MEDIEPYTPAELRLGRLLLGPAVIAVGGLLSWATGAVLRAATGEGVDASWIPNLLLAAAVLSGLFLLWRSGQGWARWVAWLIAILLLPGAAIFTFIGIWAAGFYRPPAADLPELIGMPIVTLVGSAISLWTTVRPPAG